MTKEEIEADQRRDFEAAFPDDSPIRHTDMECLLLGLPPGSYKSERLRVLWEIVQSAVTSWDMAEKRDSQLDAMTYTIKK